MKRTVAWVVGAVLGTSLLGCGLHAGLPATVRAAGTASAQSRAPFPTGYHTLATLQSDLQALAKKYPAICHPIQIGESNEHRPLWALEIASHPGQAPAALVTAGMHAQMLPPVEVAYRLADELATGYGHDKALTQLVDGRDIFIVPMVNPDGRARVEAGDRFWWRNARGVNVDHNFDDHWAPQVDPLDPTNVTELAYDDPNSENYHGTAPFSEPEAVALRDFCNAHRFTLSVDLNNYQGHLYWGPGYDANAKTPDEATFEAIASTIGPRAGVRTGTEAATITLAYGDFVTWAYDTHKTIALGVSLADSGYFAPAAEVDRDWQTWSPNLNWLLSIADDPRAHAKGRLAPRG